MKRQALFFAVLFFSRSLSHSRWDRALRWKEQAALAIDIVAQHGTDQLIIADGHAWTDYTFMGHPRIFMPNIDRLRSYWLLSVDKPSRDGWI